MLDNLLRYLLMFAVLLTSNSQALMAAQSLLTESGNQVEDMADNLPPCHRTTEFQSKSGLPDIQLECERDCNCCGGSCSSFAMTLDLPLGVSTQQHYNARITSLFFPLKRLESLQRPPIFA